MLICLKAATSEEPETSMEAEAQDVEAGAEGRFYCPSD